MARVRRTTRDRLVAHGAALALSLTALAPAPAQLPTFPARDVRVAVTVQPNGLAMVRQEYRLSGPVANARFEYLTVPCAVVGPVAIRAGGVPFDHEVSSRGPWVQLGDSSHAFSTADTIVMVSYDVRLTSRDVGIPLVLPGAPLAHDGSYATRRLRLEVNFAAGNAGEVHLPRLQRPDTGAAWSGQLLAFPSIVRVRLGDGSEAPRERCVETLAASSSRRLSMLLLVLSGTMALWVPLYFLWVSTTAPRPSVTPPPAGAR
jgi:hypothetical protein